ncbi:MAG: hypothetical protein WC872_04370 [Candidatus Absconditabacterales bacterium]
MKTPELITSVEDKVLKVSIEKIYSSEEEAKKGQEEIEKLMLNYLVNTGKQPDVDENGNIKR